MAGHTYISRKYRATLLAISLLLAAVPEAAAKTVLFDELTNRSIATEITKSASGTDQSLRIVGVPLGNSDGPSDAALDLRSMDVFAADARITIQTPDGEVVRPAPRHLYFGGSIEGRHGSRAVVTLLESGGIRGIVYDSESWWRIGDVEEQDRKRSIVRRVDPGEGEEFHCGNGDLPPDLDSLVAGVRDHDEASHAEATHDARKVADKGTAASYTARIAFETDEEYLGRFGGNTADATDYVGDLVALGSMVYTDEVATSWQVQSVNLWTTTDPWDESPGSCALYEFGKYWNDNNSGVDRTIAHMLSGKSANSGVAWVGVLCDDTFGSFPIVTGGCVEVPTNINGADYGGDYGFTGGIDGNLDINSPAPLWDSVAVLHEIGHNFNSPHTHCYNGIGGSSDPIDMCFSGQTNCYAGPTSLPSGCPGSGSNCGTIMSYCHFQPGGISGNVSLTLGESWNYGILPDRVPDRMNAHVVSQADSNPGCLDLVPNDSIFSDGFESGNTSAWSSTSP
ncbi:MAG: zinc-dependent metalloprotease [Thermoanaerobaculia bacterium]|nr:zinc-dependent metalloprotease [Thermoanaerobaculia bacterium]